MEKKDKLIHILEEEVKDKARENGWDDVLTLEDDDLIELNPLSDDDIFYEKPEEMSTADADLLEEYTKEILELQEDIDITRKLLEEKEKNYMKVSELREDLANDERKMYEYNKLLDEQMRKYDRRSR